MNELRMPTTVPSPVDRGDFRFVAVDAAGTTWQWIDERMVWVRVHRGTEPDDPGMEGCDFLH